MIVEEGSSSLVLRLQTCRPESLALSQATAVSGFRSGGLKPVVEVALSTAHVDDLGNGFLHPCLFLIQVVFAHMSRIFLNILQNILVQFAVFADFENLGVLSRSLETTLSCSQDLATRFTG